MSNLPRPSRLPGVVKRALSGDSPGLNSKRSRIDSASNLNKNKSKSMMVLNKKDTGLAALNKIPPTTGRVSSVTTRGFVKPNDPKPLTRIGLSDRTNSVPVIKKLPSKRPQWDTKGRLEDLELRFATNSARLEQLESQNSVLKTNVQEKETVVFQNSEELNRVKEYNRNLEEELRSTKKDFSDKEASHNNIVSGLQRKIADLEFEASRIERQLKALNDELDVKGTEISSLHVTIGNLSAANAGNESKVKVLECELEICKQTVASLTELTEKQTITIEIQNEKERNYETERRKLHNLIQELKGNIRVFCRIRPSLDEEEGGSFLRHIDIKEDCKSLEILKNSEGNYNDGLSLKNKSAEFQFDKVFGPTSTQDQVFEEICQLIQSAIDGYNVCVFAYGQTGSGKTYTMEGGETYETEGMIPKTIRKIFDETKRLVDKGWMYTLEVSFVEIYNEEIRDLLATQKNLKYEIKMMNNSKSVYVSNAKIETVTTEEQINAILKRARKNRVVAATNCNERSSRSHSVFIMNLNGKNSITAENCSGSLNLVDLAGSERLKDSLSEGLRLKETLSINKSLSTLSNVIISLANKDSHVPYRNSKLTHLLQNSLGGNSKTLMFVNISPREDYVNETLNSLRFATTVNQCQIGTATKKIKT